MYSCMNDTDCLVRDTWYSSIVTHRMFGNHFAVHLQRFPKSLSMRISDLWCRLGCGCLITDGFVLLLPIAQLSSVALIHLISWQFVNISYSYCGWHVISVVVMPRHKDIEGRTTALELCCNLSAAVRLFDIYIIFFVVQFYGRGWHAFLLRLSLFFFQPTSYSSWEILLRHHAIKNM